MAGNGRRSGQSPANIAKQLGGIKFPATKEDLVRHAKQGESDPDALEVIKQMPDHSYDNMADVMKAVGEIE